MHIFPSPYVLPILFPSGPSSPPPFLRDDLYLYLDFYICLYLYLRLSTSISISVFTSPSSSPALFRVLYLCPYIARWLVQLTPLSYLSLFSLKLLVLMYSGVFRDRKLSSFHDRLPGTIRQQFVPTVKTRDCNGILCGH